MVLSYSKIGIDFAVHVGVIMLSWLLVRLHVGKGMVIYYYGGQGNMICCMYKNTKPVWMWDQPCCCVGTDTL